MRIRKNDIKLWCYGISLSFIILQQTAFVLVVPILSATKIIAIGSCFLGFIFDLRENHKIKDVLAFLLFFILICYGIIVNNVAQDVIFIPCYLYLCRSYAPERVLKIYCFIVMIILITTISSWMFGLLPNEVIYGRSYLGFRYCTYAPNYLLSFVIAYCAGYKNKTKPFFWLLLLLLNTILFIKTQTSSAFFFIIILFFLHHIQKNRTTINSFLEKIKKPIILLAFISAFFILGLQLLYNSHYTEGTFVKINELVNTRLKMGKIAMERYKIGPIGQNVQWHTHTSSDETLEEYFYVDSSYLQILIQYGIIPLTAVCLLFAFFIKKVYIDKRYFLLLSAIVLLIHCIFDPQLLSFRYDPLIICAFYSTKNNKKEQKTIS